MGFYNLKLTKDVLFESYEHQKHSNSGVFASIEADIEILVSK